MKRTLVKERTTRKIERVVSPDGVDVHVKRIILEHHWPRRVLALLGRNAAASEARNLVELRRRGILSPEVVGHRTLWSRGLPVALEITTRTLEGFAPVPANAEAEPGFGRALGAYLRSLHDQGVFHGDLHRGNLLMDSHRTMALIDADKIRFVRRTTVAHRTLGLRRALLAFRALRSGSAWSEFLTGYGEKSAGIDSERLARMAESDLLRHLRSRSLRALRENPDFGREESGGVIWQVRTGYLPPMDLESACASARILKSGSSATVLDLPEHGVLKKFHRRGLLGRLKSLLRPSRARRVFRLGHLLELLEIPTPKVLACWPGDSRRSAESLLICERVPEAEHATAFLARTTERRRREVFLRAIGTLVGSLHRSGLSHRDLKGRNVLRGVHDSVALVDLDGLRDAGTSLSDARIMKDLARHFRSGMEISGISLRDPLAWAEGYLLARRMSGPRARLVRAAISRLGPKIRQKSKGRPQGEAGNSHPQ